MEMVMSHENWADELNAAHDNSEIVGGAYLDKLAVGRKLTVECRDCTLTVERREDGLYINGHEKFCPVPTLCIISGSVYAKEGSMLRMGFIGRGMYMEFHTDAHPRRIVTSEVLEVTEI
jgi:hypothetical protein